MSVRLFNKNWSAKYIFTEVRGQNVFSFREQMTEFKDPSLNQHYYTKDTEKYKNSAASVSPLIVTIRIIAS